MFNQLEDLGFRCHLLCPNSLWACSHLSLFWAPFSICSSSSSFTSNILGYYGPLEDSLVPLGGMCHTPRTTVMKQQRGRSGEKPRGHLLVR